MKKLFIVMGFLFSIVYGGSDAFAFLDFGIGCRALSMGNASVASVNDASAIFWNPAKVGIIPHTMLSGFFLMKPLGDWSLAKDQNMSFSFIQSLKKYGGLGVSFYQFKLGDIEYYPYENAEPVSISNAQNVIYLTYGRTVLPYLSMGINLKYYSQSFSEIENYTPVSSGFSADFGLYFINSQLLSLGLLYQPAVTITWNDAVNTKDEIPAKAALGIMCNVSKNFILGADVKTKEDRSIKFCLGGEYCYNPLTDITDDREKSFISLRLRAGIRDLSFETNQRDNYGFTSGVGFNLALPLADVSIDYALIIRPNIFGMSHGLNFGMTF